MLGVHIGMTVTGADAFTLSIHRRHRQYVTPWIIADHHGGLPDDRCWRCWTAGPLDRAHLIDRCMGGLDGAQNLALLCYQCHRRMPSFEPGQEREALAYAFLAFDLRMADFDLEPYWQRWV